MTPEAQEIRRTLEVARAKLDKMAEQKTSISELMLWWTETMDALLIRLFRDVGDEENFALLAQGGYGRRELSYHSDIDLLFLYRGSKNKILKQKVEKVLYPLWDIGLNVGFAVRTAKECLQLAKEDLTILTSLLDARYLAGQNKLYQDFQGRFTKLFRSKRFIKNFLTQKSSEQWSRIKQYGSSVYLLEPNTKEGQGGLRDYHHLRWALKALLNTDELARLEEEGLLPGEEIEDFQEAVAFIQRVRFELHRLSRRKNDQILLEYQEPLARQLGFKDSEKILAVENFMQTYYHHAAECRRITEKVITRMTDTRRDSFDLKVLLPQKKIEGVFRVVNGKLAVSNPKIFQEHPEYLLRIFWLMQQEGLEIEYKTKTAITEHAKRIDEALRSRADMGELFRHMLGKPETILPALQEMHSTRILERFLPEFKNLMFRAQHDVYHLYTVDTHSIFAVGEFGKVLRNEYASLYPTLTQVAQGAQRKDLLAFAIFYHDIGKGEGSGHVEKGAPLIRTAGERLGFSSEDVDTLEFLERAHLTMPHLAFRRDLDDPGLVLEFAESIREERLLEYLYVLTCCDIKAVNPDALTRWKETLLEQLFLKTHSVLKRGDFSKERASEVAKKLQVEVTLLAGNDVPEAEVSSFFKVMPLRYFLTAEAVTILDHIHIRRQFQDDPIVIHHQNLGKEKISQLTLYSFYAPKLLPKVCGVMAANNMNIYEMQVSETKDGFFLLTLKMLTAQGRMLTNRTKWQHIEDNLREVLTGTVQVQALVSSRLKPVFLQPKQARHFPPRIVIDNNISPFYTVIDLYAHDRIGLLYEITQAMSSLGLRVDVSKIATKVDQVSDVFYVRDIFGQKIISEEKLKRIQETLYKVIT